jgi:hypothetical protein
MSNHEAVRQQIFQPVLLANRSARQLHRLENLLPHSFMVGHFR